MRGMWPSILGGALFLAVSFGAMSSHSQWRAEGPAHEPTNAKPLVENTRAEGAASDDEPEHSKDGLLRIGYAGSPPFVESGSGGEPEGLSIRVWRALALRMASSYELESKSSVEDALRSLEDGGIDVAVGPISITADRARRVAFTQPYFDTSIAIAAPPGASLWARVRPLVSKAFLTALAVLLLVLTLVGTLTWFVERKTNTDEFPKPPLSGIGNGIWFALVTMTTVGYGDRSPKTLPGRIIASGWMLVALITTSSLTAGIATALTLVGLDRSAIASAGELDGKRAAVVRGTLSESFPSQHGAMTVAAANLEEAVQLVVDGDADALVFDRPALEYFVSTHPDVRLEISSRPYRPQGYGFAVRKDSPHQHRMNVHLLQMKEDGKLPTSIHDAP